MICKTPGELAAYDQGIADERERIVQVLIYEISDGGLNGLDEGDIRGLLEPE